MKGYLALCYNVGQNGGVDKHQEKIKNWKKMVSKIKDKFFLVDYEQSLCRESTKFESKIDIFLGLYKRILQNDSQIRTKRATVSKLSKVCEWIEGLDSRWDEYPFFPNHGWSISDCFQGRGKVE